MRYSLRYSYRNRQVWPQGTSLLLLGFVVVFVFLWHWLIPKDTGPVIPIWRHDVEELVEMPLEEYVKGVVAAEMPASFHFEALKAQAVAARTYALYHINSGRRIPENPRAVLSTDHRTGQAWVSRQSLYRKWGPVGYLLNWRKISRAVESTRGLVLTYGGEPILALYHSTSGGRTEAAENYWGSARPYLRSVISPWETDSPYFTSKVCYSTSEIARRLGLELPTENTLEWEGVKAEVPPVGDIPPVGDSPEGSGDPGRGPERETLPAPVVKERYPSGRVKTIEIFGESLSGRELRELLGLRSSWFEVETDGDEVTFYLRGYGHGVGMSQYGAHGLAFQGYSFKEILGHYYHGVSLTSEYAGFGGK